MTSKDSTTKPCSSCNKEKGFSEYNKCLANKDGLHGSCKACRCEQSVVYYRTKKGIATKVYSNQKHSSKRRGDEMPNYTKRSFMVWLFSQVKFHELYDLWVKSDYSSQLIPSCDRLDDYLPYTLNNLQIMTWQENYNKGISDRKNGVNNKLSKSVVQMDINGGFIAEHYSLRNAARLTGVFAANILICCKRIGLTTGGFRWMYSTGIPIFNNKGR